MFAVPVITDSGGPAVHPDALARPTATPGLGELRAALADQPPIGEVISLPLQSKKKGMGAVVWFSKVRLRTGGTGVILCAWSRTESSGGTVCEGPDLSATTHADHMNGASSVQSGEALYGSADGRVASVTTRLTNGGRRPGFLTRPKGAPLQVWQAGSADTRSVQAVEFNDSAGKVIGRITPEHGSKQPVHCDDQEMPTGGVVELAKAGADRLSATWKGNCLTFWAAAKPVGSLRTTSSLTQAARQDGATWWSSGSWWYGITGPTTTRVELRFSDGHRISTRLTRPAWAGEQVTLFAGVLPPGRAVHGAEAIGYGADGKVLWRKPMPGP
jgi:hypothetical protein